MDPNKALERMRELASRIVDANPEWEENTRFVLEDCTELAELFCGLDEWISKGGFLPQAWQET